MKDEEITHESNEPVDDPQPVEDDESVSVESPEFVPVAEGTTQEPDIEVGTEQI